LSRELLSGDRVDDFLHPPPSKLLELGREVSLKLLEGHSVRKCIVEGFADGGKDVELHRLRDGEGGCMFGLPHVAVIKADFEALRPEELQCLAWNWTSVWH
jgi:hypothetical protein